MNQKPAIDLPPIGSARNIPLDDEVPTGVRKPEHVLDRRSALAINAAIAADRPLLVRGEPGMGKSQLARAAACALGWNLREVAVDAQTEPRDLLYDEDIVQRLSDAHVTRSDEARLPRSVYVRPGALWWAFDPVGAGRQERVWDPGVAPSKPDPHDRCGTVVLIDEIDKAEGSVPNALLEALGRRRFDTPCGVVSRSANVGCLVMLTTNEERVLPDAFVRRCLVLHLSLPVDRDGLVRELLLRADAHFGDDVAREVKNLAAEMVADRRLNQEGGTPPPGVAEYIDLLSAVHGLDNGLDLLRDLAQFVLHKHDAGLSGAR